YGFPVDLTADIARERQLSLDMAGFEQAMEKQKSKARSASRFESDAALDLDAGGETRFTGYEQLGGEASVQALFQNGEKTSELTAGQQGVVVLDNTVFYAESGGQVGDIGRLRGSNASFIVEDTRKQGNQFLHYGTLETGTLKPGDRLQTEVD